MKISIVPIYHFLFQDENIGQERKSQEAGRLQSLL
jgi:hypothetical protein